MGIFDWYRRQKYWLSLSKEQKERYKKERECHGHLFVEVKGGGKKGEEPYPDEIYLECSKCGYGYYKSTLTREEREEERKNYRPIKNWNDPKKMETPTLKLEGKINGIEKKYHKNGKLWVEVNMKNGKRDGVEKQYYETGEILCEQHLKDGKLNGPNKHYDINGDLIINDNYKDDLLHGTSENYKNGILTVETNYKEGLRDGIHKEYNESFKTLSVWRNYKLGKLHGDQMTYYFNQLIERIDEYKNDVLIGSKMYYDFVSDISSGEKDKEGNEITKKGQPLGEEMIYDINGERENYKQYHPNEQLKLQINYKDKKIISQKCWDEDGNETECE